MFGSLCLAFLAAVTCGPTIGLLVDAQSTVDDNASCQSSALDEAVNRITEEVKAACAPNQQQRSVVDASSLTANCVPMMIQQNTDGSNFFNRSWAEFKIGFNDTRGNYWLGNDLLSQLTLSGRYKLRVDLQASANLSWYYAEYSSFVVNGESDNYKLLVAGYSGNAGDAFYYQNGMMFTTYDRDNDQWTTSKNCAVVNGGGFWYTLCSTCSINVLRGRPDNFRWASAQYGNLLLQSSRMWLMC